jgi:hypothetical protein
MRLFKILAASALLVAGTAPVVAASATGEARLAKILAGRVPGKPQHCIYLPSISDTQIITGTAIVYNAGRTIYVNRPVGGARTLSSGDVMVTKPTNSELCNVDIVRIFDQGQHFERGFVNLGDFVPYRKPGVR